jgi:hypothetical protein
VRIFILGAGATGGYLARLLIRQRHEVWCGDRDPLRMRRFLDPDIRCEPANARNLWSIVRAARGAHLLINAAPATFNETVLRAALRLRAHYLDMAANLRRHPFQPEALRYDARFQNKNRAALICAGVAPGLTNLLVARSADWLDSIEEVRIRLYENVDSDTPVSTWSAEIAFDEAVSRPTVYRQGHFTLAKRFAEPEWFSFPAPVGRSRVVLAAQDEAATLPRFLAIKDLDVKIGGNEFDRLRRWHRQGKLRPSAGRSRERFPATPSPRQVAKLMRRGLLGNARFAAAVVVRGMRKSQPTEHRWDCAFPTLHQLRLEGLTVTPIAYSTAHCAALFVKHLPRDLPGVRPPEALPREVRVAVLREVQARGLRIAFKARPWRRPEGDNDSEEAP